MDPLAPEYPFYTPYAFAGNSPTKYIDIDGLEPGIDETWVGYNTYDHTKIAKDNGLMKRVNSHLKATINGYDPDRNPEHAKTREAWFITNAGHIFEDAALRSYNLAKNKQSLTGIPGSPVPDAAEDGGFMKQGNSVFYPRSTLYEVKFKSFIAYNPEENPYQLDRMIGYLGMNRNKIVTGVDIFGNAAEEGVAVLVFITPFNGFLSPQIKEEASSVNVKIFQMKMYQDPSGNRDVRVSYPGRIGTIKLKDFQVMEDKMTNDPTVVKMNWNLPLVAPGNSK